MSQFEFLLGKAVPLQALRSDKPFMGPTFVCLFCLSTTIFLMNMLVSILNESYGDAKANAEESAEELEMARFIEERAKEMFHEGSSRTEFRLFCDETTFVNMCLFEAEPFCLNSEAIIRSTELRMENVEKRLFAITKRTESMKDDLLQEENDFMNLLYTISNSFEHVSYRQSEAELDPWNRKSSCLFLWRYNYINYDEQ